VMAIVESAPTDLLLEREEPLAALHAALADAAAGRGRLVFVGGEAGVGQTSLIRRFCAELPAGTALFSGGCDALATPRPLGPFLEIAEAAGIDGALDAILRKLGVSSRAGAVAAASRLGLVEGR
jgi:predicted ATPase